MYFKITYNKGKERHVQAKSKAEGMEVEDRLKTIKLQGHIKSYERIEFDRVSPDEILKKA